MVKETRKCEFVSPHPMETYGSPMNALLNMLNSFLCQHIADKVKQFHMFPILLLCASQLQPFRLATRKFEFKLSDADYHHISTPDEIKTLFSIYGIDTTNEIFQALNVKDEHCAEGKHLHGVLDGKNLGVACIPTCKGTIVSEPSEYANKMTYSCVSKKG